jgi:hypothetical protein
MLWVPLSIAKMWSPAPIDAPAFVFPDSEVVPQNELFEKAPELTRTVPFILEKRQQRRHPPSTFWRSHPVLLPFLEHRSATI